MLDNHKHREARRVLYSRDNITSLSFEILELGNPTKDGGPTINDLLTLSRDIVQTHSTRLVFLYITIFLTERFCEGILLGNIEDLAVSEGRYNE